MKRPEDNRLIRIILSGRFSVESADGTDLTPRGAKTQGLLALLATSPALSRNRRWLEDKLWSDRGSDQASASLRQALSELRRALGPDASVLVADRQRVGLIQDRVRIEALAGDQEFLEGIDVRDPEFESWLRSERHRQISLSPMAAVSPPAVAAYEVKPPPVPLRRSERRALVIVLQKSRMVPDGLSLIEDIFIDCVALSLREALGVTVFTRQQKPELPNTVTVTVQAIAAAGGERFLRARAVEMDSGRLLWAGNSAGLGGFRAPDDPAIVLFANQAVEVLGDAFTLQVTRGEPLDAMVLQRLAVRKLWTMNPARMAEAEALLALSDEMAPRGLNAARLAQLRVLQLVERHGTDRKLLREEALAYCRLAMEREPNNSMVLAVVAYARCSLDETPAYGADLARRSVRMNPNSPLAWDSLSYAKLYAGQVDEAHQIALRVQKIGAASPNKFWWDMGLCLTAAVVRDDALALRMADAAVAEAPEFRAALRYVVALNAGLGQPEAALAAASRLQLLESDFKLDQLALDPAYPVGVLRRSGLLRSDRILAIAG